MGAGARLWTGETQNGTATVAWWAPDVTQPPDDGAHHHDRGVGRVVGGCCPWAALGAAPILGGVESTEEQGRR
jgi:hypothetical protein